jgi:hypothetical protein
LHGINSLKKKINKRHTETHAASVHIITAAQQVKTQWQTGNEVNDTVNFVLFTTAVTKVRPKKPTRLLYKSPASGLHYSRIESSIRLTFDIHHQ